MQRRCSKSQQVRNPHPEEFVMYCWWLVRFETICSGTVLVKGWSGAWLFFGKSQPILFQPVDVVAEFKRRSQLESQILHHHLAFQQEQSVSVYLMLPEGLGVGSQGLGVSIFDEPNDLLNAPAGWVLTSGTLALSSVWHRTVSIPVSFLEASWTRCLSAQAHWSRATATTVTIGVLWWVLRCHDIEGRVTGIYSVALGVH